MKVFALALMLICALAGVCRAMPTDDIAEALIVAGSKPITPDSLPADFARLTRFVRHDGNGMVLFTDGGATDGYVRHAQAHFDTAPAAHDDAGMHPLFSVAFELVDQPDFSFDGLAASLEQKLGAPDNGSNRLGATFRTWNMKQPAGRTLTIAKGRASDNGDGVIIVQLIQER
jgi:hypothetical protein